MWSLGDSPARFAVPAVRMEDFEGVRRRAGPTPCGGEAAGAGRPGADDGGADGSMWPVVATATTPARGRLQTPQVSNASNV